MEKCIKRRFYCPELAKGRVSLSVEESHHARSVLRLGEGDRVELFDGRGSFASGVIVSCDKRSTLLDVESVEFDSGDGVAIHLAIAVPKGKRMDYLAEKAAELAVASLQPVRFNRSVAGGEELSAARRDKCLNQFIASAKQCSLNRLPELRQTIGVTDLSALLKKKNAIFGYLGPGVVTVAAALRDVRPPYDLTVVVGPEGGITDEEKDMLLAAGAVPVRLGSTIFRVETAGVALVSAARTMIDE
jgi:16S rRNA (uracil1498-N3)-methyltransferase